MQFEVGGATITHSMFEGLKIIVMLTTIYNLCLITVILFEISLCYHIYYSALQNIDYNKGPTIITNLVYSYYFNTILRFFWDGIESLRVGGKNVN